MKVFQRLATYCLLVCFLSFPWDTLCEELDWTSSDELCVLYSDDMSTMLYVQNDDGPYDLIVPEGVVSIDNDALLHACIEKIQLPSTMKDFLYALRNNPLLAEICVASENKYYISVDGVLFSRDKKTLLLYPPSKKGKTYRIPNGTQYIADEAFAFAKELVTLYIPDSVTTIGDFSFYCARGLNEVVGGQALEKIGQGAFMGCAVLREFEFPNTINEIGKQAFCETAFEMITIPDSVLTIPSEAFGCCEFLNRIYIGPKVISIAEDSFLGIDLARLIISTTHGSVADTFAQEKGFLVDYCYQQEEFSDYNVGN